MRKYAFILGVIATVALTSCGSGSTTEVTTDSTAVSLDTTKAQTPDTTVTEVKVDSTKK
jgi:hypothetical protein